MEDPFQSNDTMGTSQLENKRSHPSKQLDWISIGGILCFVVINKYQKGNANPFVSILGEAGWLLDWISKLGG